MPPILKENESLAGTPEAPARSGSALPSNGDAGAKQQPVALEVPVTVNGARTIEGSDRREPFSESTKTVLIFGSGAVIRLTSSVATGQLLFLTNERTKKEVVCQVVKSKNYRNVSGYVELEFTEPVVGFWGMRFPGDRIGSGPAPAPVANPPAVVSGSPVPPRPPAARVEQPAIGALSGVTPKAAPPASSTDNLEPKLSESKFVTPEAPAAVKPAAPVAPSILPSGSSTSSIVAPPMDSVSLLSSSAQKKDAPAPASPVAAPPPISVPHAAEPVEPAPIMPTARNFDISNRSDEQASFLAPAQAPKTPASIDLSNLAAQFEVKHATPPVAPPSPPPSAPNAPSTIDLSSLAPFFEVKPSANVAVPAPPPQAPPSVDPETEALKQHTARLQEQLSSMLFTERAPSVPSKTAPETSSVPSEEKEGPQKSLAEVVELPKATAPSPEPILALPAEPAQPAAEQKISSLEEEELKIPAWLEPLARNASAPSSTQELILREKAKRAVEQTKVEEEEEAFTDAAAPVTTEEEPAVEPRLPEFGSALAIDGEENTVEPGVKRSGKGLLIGALAAAVVLAAVGGWWYFNQRPAATHAVSVVAQVPAVSNPAPSLPQKPQKEATSSASALTPEDPAVSSSPAQANAIGQSNPVSNAAGVTPASVSVISTRNSQPAANNSVSGATVVTSIKNTQPDPAAAQVKKPALGEVRLAAPRVLQNRSAQSGQAVDEGIVLENEEPENNAESLGTGLAVTSKPAAPAAPGPVGGDVKQAKLISSVPPVYPALAKAQHVSGSVTIDALIDATGRVTSTKIISGPTLLHQAAIEALRQWKYQPATLNGQPVPMHLNVTLQFRLQ
jgi:protein TonB